MKRSKVLVIFWLFICVIVSAQNKNRHYVSFTKNKEFFHVHTNDGHYKIRPFSTKIIETSFIPKGEVYNSNSHAVVLKPKNVEFEIMENEISIHLKSSGISVLITKSPFQINYFYKNKPLISERKGYLKTEKREVLDFNLSTSEVLYGAGARALGMNRRGYRLHLYNRAHYGYEEHSELMNFTMPLVYSSKMYAIHFDNAPIGFLDLDSKKDNSLQYETISGRKTYQIVAGDTWDDLINQYTNLTGKQPLIPRWALGNFASRFGYHSQKETEETVNKVFDEKIPLDAVRLDLYWFGKNIKGTMGNLEFLKDSFPNPKKMIEGFKKKGIKTVLITEPFILTTSKKWDAAVDKGILGKTKDGKPYTYNFYFGNTGIIDILNPNGKQWFWNIYKNLNTIGVAGWWGDLGEPEVHPSDLLHATGTADEVHNVYGHYWAKLIADGYKKDFANQRPFILMRAGYSGSQHYGLIPWSGDVNRSWGGFKPQPEIALQMAMQGMAYMHSDLGGFAGANLDDELYVRWLQYGVFQPIYRPHAQEQVPSEPVYRNPKTKELAKQAIQLRYQLLPYNYTLAFLNSKYGTPLMRPLFFEEPPIKDLLTYDKAYYWGQDFLISPVMQKGITSQEIYFPSNSNWYNFYTDEKVEGGQSKVIQLNKESIPTYVRGGAFVPMVKTIQTTSEYYLTNFDLHFYFDKDSKESTGQLFNDDGETPNSFKKGQYELLTFESSLNKNRLLIIIKTEVGDNYKASDKIINLIVHNIESKPKTVRGFDFKYNKRLKTLIIPVKMVGEINKSIQFKISN